MVVLRRFIIAALLGVLAFLEIALLSISRGPVLLVVAPGHGLHLSDLFALMFGLLVLAVLGTSWAIVWIRRMRRCRTDAQPGTG